LVWRADFNCVKFQSEPRRQVPVIGEGQGVWNWVHIEDAAAATTAALDCAPGAYNLVDDDPSP